MSLLPETDIYMVEDTSGFVCLPREPLSRNVDSETGCHAYSGYLSCCQPSSFAALGWVQMSTGDVLLREDIKKASYMQ